MKLHLPHMVFENWSSDMESYKIYNLLVAMFAIIFVCILVVVGFILFVSQFFIKTNLSLPTYALYRINGLSLNSILRSWLIQALLMCLVGVALSVPLTIYLMNKFMAMVDLRNFLSVNAQIAVVLSVFAMVAISAIPSVILLYKRRDNVVCDV
jgi:hypothetical protein